MNKQTVIVLCVFASLVIVFGIILYVTMKNNNEVNLSDINETNGTIVPHAISFSSFIPLIARIL